MAVIAVAGGPGAPGATTAALALLLAWPLQPGRRILLVECDPDGGAVLAGALEGRVEAVYGLRNLAVADRRGLLAQTLWEQLIDLSPDGNAERLLLPGLTDPAQAPGLAYTWEPLMEVLHGLEPQGYDVILDLGRSGATGAGAVLARRADAVAVTVRTTLRGLSAARPRLSALAEDLAASGTGADAMGLLLVAEGPYSGAEVSREFGLPVIGLLPHAVRTARVLSDGGDTTDRRFIRSELMRTARSAADEVQLLVRRRRQRLAPSAAPAPAPAAPAPDPGGRPLAYAPPQPAPVSPASPPAGQVPQPAAPVITTGPVAPLAGLAPQPAAPAPFPAHGWSQEPQPPHAQATPHGEGTAPTYAAQPAHAVYPAPAAQWSPAAHWPSQPSPDPGPGAAQQYGQQYDPPYGQQYDPPYGQQYGQQPGGLPYGAQSGAPQTGAPADGPAQESPPQAAPGRPYGRVQPEQYRQDQPPSGQGPRQSPTAPGEVLRAR
ncbi:hypothetical protein ACFP0N_01685 [Kitasatospora aburaviensis]|uniref:Cellulose biosynthesis protein BcsQ n=1 Tax=Kitasatospora aburaviensis TaxID=67265 RepID=A0ABW1EPH4_9ACTN